MEKLNEEAAPNNNLSPVTIKTSEKLVGEKNTRDFSEELSDGGGRNQVIESQKKAPLSKIKW